VERASCDSDRRVVYAVLTDAGRERLRSASTSHVAQIEELFAARLDRSEQAQFASLLERISLEESDEDCAAPDA
jgi:MarR family transcriptional regulator, 2-MHQ and catechol-resistance regulon repressor